MMWTNLKEASRIALAFQAVKQYKYHHTKFLVVDMMLPKLTTYSRSSEESETKSPQVKRCMIAKREKLNKEKEKLLTHSSWDQVITAVFAAVHHEDHGHYLYQNPGNWCVPDYHMPISNKTCYYSYPKQTWSKLHQAYSEHDPFAATHCKQNW